MSLLEKAPAEMSKKMFCYKIIFIMDAAFLKWTYLA